MLGAAPRPTWSGLRSGSGRWHLDPGAQDGRVWAEGDCDTFYKKLQILEVFRVDHTSLCRHCEAWNKSMRTARRSLTSPTVGEMLSRSDMLET
mmetsp:Transcript_150344/g.483166  ORF Transcript_150344/g.483166 Transcript_150344/m.483166 type:complete len:93 (+) Transcript_150344:48-326(+)